MNKRCQQPGCNNFVSKQAFKLCLDCYWKQPSSKKTSNSKETSSVKKTSSLKKASSSQKASGSQNILGPYDIAKHFNIQATDLNKILNELGWVEKAGKGWKPTTLGVSMKASYKGMSSDDKSYVNWPKSILQNDILRKAVSDYSGDSSSSTDSNIQEFRQKYPARIRTTDGHMVRSRGELVIDNYLYYAGLAHGYERRLPVEEEIYCDFYLHKNKICIEYWGLETDSKNDSEYNKRYEERKKKKQEIYQKYKDRFTLIELDNNQVDNLDDCLPQELLKHGIKVN